MKAHGRLYKNGSVWVVEAVPHVVMKLKRWFPQASSRERGGIKLASTPEVCWELAWMRQRFRLECSAIDQRYLQIGAAKHEEREHAVDALLSGRADPLEGMLIPAREPRDYQLVAADLALTVCKGLLLGDELGIGKTMSGLLVLREPNALPALAVVPTHLERQWLEELAATFPELRGHILKGLTPYEPKTRRGSGGKDPDLLVIGYSRIRGWGDALAGRVRTMLLDEVQEARRIESDKYVALKQVADAADVVMGMSATPVYNYGIEVHNIYEVLAPGELGSREEFGREWCGGSSGPKARVEDPGALSEYLKGRGLFLRRSRRDVKQELPYEPQRLTHAIDSDHAIYDKMEADAFDLVDTILDSVVPQEQFQARGQLDWKLREATGVAKAPFVAAFTRMLLEGGEPKVLLLGWHRRVYETWLRELEPEFGLAMYTGSESPTAKQASKARFIGGDLLDMENEARRRRGQQPMREARVLAMSLRSGLGLNGLQQVCRTAVFGELDWSPGMHDQCEGRIDRSGQVDPVVSYFLVSNKGTDPLMAEVLALKLPQGKLFVDPDAQLFTSVPDEVDRIRKLAEQVRERRAKGHR